MKMLRSRKGQTVVEWVALAAIVIGIVMFMYSRVRGPAANKVTEIETNLQTNTQQP